MFTFLLQLIGLKLLLDLPLAYEYIIYMHHSFNDSTCFWVITLEMLKQIGSVRNLGWDRLGLLSVHMLPTHLCGQQCWEGCVVEFYHVTLPGLLTPYNLWQE